MYTHPKPRATFLSTVIKHVVCHKKNDTIVQLSCQHLVNNLKEHLLELQQAQPDSVSNGCMIEFDIDNWYSRCETPKAVEALAKTQKSFNLRTKVWAFHKHVPQLSELRKGNNTQFRNHNIEDTIEQCKTQVTNDTYIKCGTTYASMEQGLPMGGALSGQLCDILELAPDILVKTHTEQLQYVTKVWRYKDNIIMHCNRTPTIDEVEQLRLFLQHTYKKPVVLEQKAPSINALGYLIHCQLPLICKQLKWIDDPTLSTLNIPPGNLHKKYTNAILNNVHQHSILASSIQKLIILCLYGQHLILHGVTLTTVQHTIQHILCSTYNLNITNILSDQQLPKIWSKHLTRTGEMF